MSPAIEGYWKAKDVRSKEFPRRPLTSPKRRLIQNMKLISTEERTWRFDRKSARNSDYCKGLDKT